MADDIFISYAREDSKRAEQLAEVLTARNWTVFWDRDILPGSAWRADITQAIEAARCVVVLWTKYSVESPFVRDEAERGRQRGILVPLTFGNVDPPIGFRETQTLNLTRWRPGGESTDVARLVEAISAILKRPFEKATSVRSKVQGSAADRASTTKKQSGSRFTGAYDGPKPKPEETIVPVPRSRLDDLRQSQQQLGIHFDNHFKCHEIAELCVRLVSRLDLWRSERTRLADDTYWKDLRDELQNTRNKVGALTQFFDEYCPEQISDFQEHLDTALNGCSTARDSGDPAERLEAAKSSFRSAEIMRQRITDVTSMSQRDMDTLLKTIGTIIDRISERIDVAAEATQQKNPAQAYSAKLLRPKTGAAIREGQIAKPDKPRRR